MVICGSGAVKCACIREYSTESNSGDCKIYLFIFNAVVVILRTQSLIN